MIYLDNSATMKPCEEAVKAAIMGMEKFGNPSSPHGFGTEASMLLRNARRDLSSIIKCDPSELYFTSGGSESNNTAIIGLAMKNSKHAKRIISTNSEHPSVAEPLAFLEKRGFEVVRLSTKGGKIDIDELRLALSQKTSLVTIMQVNNETGAVYDLEAVRKEIDKSESGAYFHSDCVQSFMKVSANFVKYCDAASISAHKIGGIKGCGGLYLKKGIKIDPLILGGGQENGFRSGTENIPGILAFSTAAKCWSEEKKERNQYILSLKQHLSAKLVETFGDGVVINTPENSVCCLLNFSIPNVKSETVINALSADGICVSASSACSTHAKENSVLSAFGLTKELSESAIRVGMSYFNTTEELDILCGKLKEISDKLVKVRIK
jgi:cysteine desulfurase